MGKRVLVAVDSYSATEPSISYGIELAARMKCSLSLLAVSSSRPPQKTTDLASSLQHADGRNDRWIDRVVAEIHQREVSLEIFVASGQFFDEVTRFVQSQPAVQFIVMAVPKDTENKSGRTFATALEQMHQEFEGEILLVEKAGHITRVSDLYLQGASQERHI